jgi:ABC-2 type transport system permease protein
MAELKNMIWIEARKALRSKMPLLTAVGFMLIPLAAGLMMFIYKDPEFARKMGLLSAKANLRAATADWPTYINIFAQAVSVGGLILFTMIGSWVFGREFVDGTVKDLLAVPVMRSNILLGKYIVMALWSVALSALIYVVGVGLGFLIGLPGGTSEVLTQGSLTVLVSLALTLLVVIPLLFFAGVGHGYLLPLGIAILSMILAQVATGMGYASYFPWAIPALYATAGESRLLLEPISYVLVALTALAGLAATYLWWKYADQNR